MKPTVSHREDRYYVLFNNYLDASVIVDYMTGRIIAVNSATLRYLCRQERDLVGQDLSVLFPGQGPAAMTQLKEEIRMFGHADAECTIQLGTQERVPTQVHATTYQYEGNQEIMLTFRACTSSSKDAQEAEQKIHKLRSLIEEMKGINFQLNNPLQELISVLELQWGQSYRKPIECITRSLGEFRKLCASSTNTPEPLAEPRRIITNEKAVACTKNRILIVDDESSIRNLFSHILRAGLPETTLETATSGPEALRAFEEGHHQLILIDYQMPGMTGEQVLRRIEEICRLNCWKMPAVILCTGHDPDDATHRLRSISHVHTCLFKPVSKTELLHEVEEKLTEMPA